MRELLTAPPPVAFVAPTRRRAYYDLAAGAVVLALALAIALRVPKQEFVAAFDMGYYAAMAEDPRAFFSSRIPGAHAQRILPSLIVYALTRLTGLALADGFALVSVAAFALFAVGVFSTLRRVGAAGAVAFGLTGLIVLAGWPPLYALYNVYQAADGLSYALGILLIRATLAERLHHVGVLGILGVLTRQSLLVLALACLARLFLRRPRVAAVAYVLAVGGVFAGTAAFAGADVPGTLVGAMTPRPGSIADGIAQVRPWVLLLPFLFVLFRGRVLRDVARFWWILPYVAITFVQPLLTYRPVVGVVNAHRLMLQGAWPLFLIAALRIARSDLAPLRAAALGFLPLLYWSVVRPAAFDSNLAAWYFAHEGGLVLFGIALALLTLLPEPATQTTLGQHAIAGPGRLSDRGGAER